jgi:hypothetical protein
VWKLVVVSVSDTTVVPSGIITSIFGCPQRETCDLRYDFIGNVDDVVQSLAEGLSLDELPKQKGSTELDVLRPPGYCLGYP